MAQAFQCDACERLYTSYEGMNNVLFTVYHNGVGKRLDLCRSCLTTFKQMIHYDDQKFEED